MLPFKHFYEKADPIRISPDSQQVDSGVSEKALEEASSIARSCHAAVRRDQIGIDSDEKTKRFEAAKAVKAKEEIALYNWAKESGLLMSSKEFTAKWEAQGKKGETEYEVYYDPKEHAWFKRNNMIYHVTYL